MISTSLENAWTDLDLFVFKKNVYNLNKVVDC